MESLSRARVVRVFRVILFKSREVTGSVCSSGRSSGSSSGLPTFPLPPARPHPHLRLFFFLRRRRWCSTFRRSGRLLRLLPLLFRLLLLPLLFRLLLLLWLLLRRLRLLLHGERVGSLGPVPAKGHRRVFAQALLAALATSSKASPPKEPPPTSPGARSPSRAPRSAAPTAADARFCASVGGSNSPRSPSERWPRRPASRPAPPSGLCPAWPR